MSRTAAVGLDGPLPAEPQLIHFILVAAIVGGDRPVPSIDGVERIEGRALFQPAGTVGSSFPWEARCFGKFPRFWRGGGRYRPARGQVVAGSLGAARPWPAGVLGALASAAMLTSMPGPPSFGAAASGMSATFGPSRRQLPAGRQSQHNDSNRQQQGHPHHPSSY